MRGENYMSLEFPSKSSNEAFARAAVACFAAQLDPTLDELGDIKTAVSEAVTNAIIHGYQNRGGMIRLAAELYEGKLVKIDIVDCGVGIEDVDKAREPLYTSSPEMERSGMGFTVMETFMDSLSVYSKRGRGTTIHMEKRLGG